MRSGDEMSKNPLIYTDDMSKTLASHEVSRMKKKVDLQEKSEEYKKLRDDMLRS